MTCYFPIPNNIENKDLPNFRIRTSVTLINHPNNLLLRNYHSENLVKNDIFYNLYTINEGKWQKVLTKKCEFGQSIEFFRDQLILPKKNFVVIVPSKENNLPSITDSLPIPYSNRFDKSPVAERASYNFHIGDATSSYQGEYPLNMAKLKRGSFFSFDSLRLDELKNSYCFILLMNLNLDASKNNKNKINLLNFDEQKKTICSFNAYSNNITTFKIPNLKFENFNNKEKNIYFSCKSETFIPIYLTVFLSENNSQINVEHTHPPTEFFWGLDRVEGVKLLKKNWLV